MQDQHKHIKGYRELTQEEIDLMNEVKLAEARIEILVEKLKKNPNVDQRFASIGFTNVQLGCMALVRSIAKPTSFPVPEAQRQEQ